MAVNSCEEEQDAYCISPLPGEVTIDLPHESKLTKPSYIEVPNLLDSQMCLDAQLNCQNCIKLLMGSADSSGTVDADIETGNLDSPNANGETARTLIFESAVSMLQRAVCRKISLEIGGKMMQLIVNYSLMLLKFTSRDKPAVESPHDTLNHRWRKYKRAASFDSRKIVLLFSALSSMGTMVLIYLTLRVRQNGGDAFVHG